MNFVRMIVKINTERHSDASDTSDRNLHVRKTLNQKVESMLMYFFYQRVPCALADADLRQHDAQWVLKAISFIESHRFELSFTVLF